MMRLGQLDALIGTLDETGIGAPVADVVASAWRYQAGAAKHWRSSASHVFAVPEARVYLRFIPEAQRDRDRVVAIAELMRTLVGRGLPVARPVPAASGDLVVTTTTAFGRFHAMTVQAAPGGQLNADGLTPGRAAAWGAALARLHREGGDAGDGLPEPFAELRQVATTFGDDRPLIAAAGDCPTA